MCAEVRAQVPFAGVWRRRLALKAAAASARIARRGEDEATLRDVFFLRHGGDDPGPAGRMLVAWRGLDRSAPLSDDAVFHVADTLQLKIDDALRIARADRKFIHIDIGRVQHRARLGHGECGDGARHVLGAQRRALQRIDGDIDFRPRFGADLLADEQHRRFVHLALANDDGAVDVQAGEFAPHGIDSGLVGFFLRSAPAQPRSRDSRTFSHADDFERQCTLKDLRPGRLG